MATREQSEDIAIIGLQTGDEGKGKIVVHLVRKAADYLPSSSENFVVNARWAGGANAGHTTISDGVTYKIHQLPSGIIVPGTYNLMGEGVFFNPRLGMQEIQQLQRLGVRISPENFGIASNAQVTLDYHVEEDLAEQGLLGNGHTSTSRGIKQTARDKQNRVGIRFEEFLDREAFLEILSTARFPNSDAADRRQFEKMADSYAQARDFLRQFSVLQTDVLTNPNVSRTIWEGAQGFRLDVDKGLYPGVTSSNPAIVPAQIYTTLGVVKLYESSVGHNRPFVGHIPDEELESRLREEFGEIGTTTGLPRDLGWFDAVAVAHAVRSTQTDFLVGTCGDRLETLAKTGEPVKLVVAYEIDGKRYEGWDKSFHNRGTLYRATPVFEEFAPWDRFIDGGRVHPNAQKYLDRIQELVGAEFVMLSHGPDENDVLELKDPLSV